MFHYKQVKSGMIIGVEAKSKDTISPNFIKTTKAEYDAFIASLPVVVGKPPRDLATELDNLDERVRKLEEEH